METSSSLLLNFPLLLSFSLYILIHVVHAQTQLSIFNVLHYGARGDGVSDNAKAFNQTWRDACASTKPSMFLIPKGKYKIGPILLMGPCKSPITFRLYGDLIAPTYDQSSNNIDQWIAFRNIDGLRINGGGSLNGLGPTAWPQKNNPNCKPLPASIKFDFVTNSRIDNITSIDSKNNHVSLFACKNITINRLNIIAPENSPNTDGIKIGSSHQIWILNSKISTGDDCIAILSGTKKLKIKNVACGPGHGISIGSLGGVPNEDDVFGIHVIGCNFTNTMNGVRIKTWAKPYKNTVSRVRFDNLEVKNVSNPIIIDQEYCPAKNCPPGASGVKISDVWFSNIRGTSQTAVAVTMKCSKSNPCENIKMTNVKIAYRGKSAKSSCSNVAGLSPVQAQPSC